MKHQGTVKWFDKKKRFGFIQEDGNSKEDVFFHESNIDALDQNIDKNERVEFEVKKTPRGLEAIKVKPLEE